MTAPIPACLTYARKPRTRADVAGFFDGLDLLAPGVVPINHWQPGSQPAGQRETPLPAYAALGRK